MNFPHFLHFKTVAMWPKLLTSCCTKSPSNASHTGVEAAVDTHDFSPPSPPYAAQSRTETCAGASGAIPLRLRIETAHRTSNVIQDVDVLDDVGCCATGVQSCSQACAGAASSTGKPGLRRFGQGDAYSARCQTAVWGAPVHARATPPLAGLALGDNVAGNRRPQPPSLTS